MSDLVKIEIIGDRLKITVPESLSLHQALDLSARIELAVNEARRLLEGEKAICRQG